MMMHRSPKLAKAPTMRLPLDFAAVLGSACCAQARAAAFITAGRSLFVADLNLDRNRLRDAMAVVKAAAARLPPMRPSALAAARPAEVRSRITICARYRQAGQRRPVLTDTIGSYWKETEGERLVRGNYDSAGPGALRRRNIILW
jgi:hypothetical protein